MHIVRDYLLLFERADVQVPNLTPLVVKGTAGKALLLFCLSLFESVYPEYGLGVFVIDAHLIRSIFYGHVLIKESD